MTATDFTAIRENATIDRREFVSALIDRVPDALIVTGLGSASYDVFAHGERDGNFYLWGAMGGAVPVGLGLALAQPDRSVVVVTGDGEMLMGIGSLGSAAVRAPDNLTVVVLDNGHFGETGMQRSHSSLGTDLVAVARGFGIADAFVQDNFSWSAGVGTLRGLHFQRAPHAQAKLVRVLRGAVLDVIVDLRRASPSFGRHVACKLSAEGAEQHTTDEGIRYDASAEGMAGVKLLSEQGVITAASSSSVGMPRK